MKTIRRPNQYLQQRGEVWHYIRRVPIIVSNKVGHDIISRSLETDSVSLARRRRDMCAEADEARWHTLMPSAFKRPSVDRSLRQARKDASAMGFTYKPVEELSEPHNYEELAHRLLHLEALQTRQRVDIERAAPVLIGTVKPDKVTITKALEIYLTEIALDEVAGKSPEQRGTYEKVKRRAVANFVKLNGDVDMRKIDREHGRKVYKFWADKVHPKNGEKPLSGSSANRDLGNLRKLYRMYFEHVGEEDRQNPFRNLRFSAKKMKQVKPFANNFVRENIMKPNVFEGLKREAALLCLALIETGCRPSELANILPENIRLDDEVPHIRIRSTSERQLKSEASIREIPLLGISLEAMKHSRDGFSHYRDRGYLLSQTLQKAFKSRGLLPSSNHRIYSFRHSFEKRMLEAGMDYGLRCTLMGHRNPRPEYGDGGSLKYRRDELMKITHPVSPELLSAYPFTAKP